MAKQQVGAVERHLEKGILGIAGLVLIGAIGRFAITTPNQMELAGGMVTPGNIDDKVLAAADRVRQRARNAEAPDRDFEPLLAEFTTLIDPFQLHQLALTLPNSGSFGPPVPILDQKLISATDRTLVEVVPMDKPTVRFGRSTLHLNESDLDGGQFRQVDWVTISSEFNIRKQSDQLVIQYGPKRKNVVFGPTELQRRARRQDASWSDDDWQTVTPNPATDIGDVPSIPLVREDGAMVVPREAFKQLDSFDTDIRREAIQLSLIRPLMLPVRDGDPWKVPVISSYKNIMRMDWQYQYPDQEPTPELEDRYGEQAAGQGRQVDEGKVVTPKMHIERGLELLQQAKDTCNGNLATKAYNEVFEVIQGKDASRGERQTAVQIQRQANQLADDIERGNCTPAGDQRGNNVKKSETVAFQQIWVHDATPGAIKPGQTYQYRMRATIINSLAGQPDKFQDPTFAQTIFIPGPWTAPTDPISFEPDTYVFVISSDKRRDLVTAEFFKWFEGVWVTTRSKFSVGDSLTKSNREKVPSLDDPDGVDEPTVTFDVSARVVDIDHERKHRERKRSRHGGVSFGSPAPECAVVWVDRAGRLHERFVTTDKRHPAKSIVAARVFKAPR